MATSVQRGVKCKRGHDDWIRRRERMGAALSWRCRPCRNMKSNNVVIPTHPQSGGPLGQKCRRGHDDWKVSADLRKKCAQCQRDWKRHGGHWASTDNRGYEGQGKLQWDTMSRSEILKARGYDVA